VNLNNGEELWHRPKLRENGGTIKTIKSPLPNLSVFAKFNRYFSRMLKFSKMEIIILEQFKKKKVLNISF